MKIFVGADHAGFELKNVLIDYLKGMGHEVEDKGALEYNESDDFPDFIIPVAREVSMHPNEVKGIVLGGSGQGEAMCANRFKHVRATVYYGKATSLVEEKDSIIKLSRDHNNGNVLSIGARFITADEMKEAVKEWLETPFTEGSRHQPRIDKIDRIQNT
ncbi:MAG: ribose 5-phosphate isomerase B [Parcubacteria bacterium C7867-005]|nr:MAG: ribose 5-phosphate isomerase B [Parcubacteria bacterium C7867-005]